MNISTCDVAFASSSHEVLGVGAADHLVRPVEQLLAVVLRHAEDLGDRLQRQLGRDVVDEVARRPARITASTISAARRLIVASKSLSTRGVNADITILRYRVCFGGSIISIIVADAALGRRCRGS